VDQLSLPKNSEAPPSGIPSWARADVKVVCINDNWNATGPARVPMLNEVLTIGDVFDQSAWPGRRIEGGGAVTLLELGHDWCFSVAHFRPLVNDADDAEIEAKLYHKKGLHQSAPRRKSVDA
jgi:hypothetical protein